RQRARQSVLVAGEGRGRPRVAGALARPDLLGRDGLAGGATVVPGQPAARQKGLDARRMSARALGALAVLRAQKGEGRVAPLSRAAVGPVVDAPVDDEPAP